MKLLLDTHILLWSLLDPERLSRQAAKELENPSNELWISPITTWEILVLAEKKRIVIDGTDPVSWLRKIYAELPFREARLNHEVAVQSRLVDLPHSDPADRFLAATAIVYELILVTADKRLKSSKKISVLK
jgi:PIN domain nuclease of toxin-antitoxin system